MYVLRCSPRLCARPFSQTVLLEGLRQELIDDGKKCVLSRTNMDQALMERLTSEAILKDLYSRHDAEASPMKYLINTYRRALKEEKPLSLLKDKEFANEIKGGRGR